MSIFSRRRRVPPNAAFIITQQGREKLQQFSGDPKSRILTALETDGSGDIEEISTRSGLSRGQVERILPGLAQGGYVQLISASSGGLD